MYSGKGWLKEISLDRGSIWWAPAAFDLRAIHLSVKSNFCDCSVVLLHMLLAQNSYVGMAINLSTRRSLVMTIPRSNRVSGWKSVLLENLNRFNQNRLWLKRLIPIEHDVKLQLMANN